MKEEFHMTQEEMDRILSINKEGGDLIIYVDGERPIGSTLQEKINKYWDVLGKKYGFKPETVEGSPKGKLFFLAEEAPKATGEVATEGETSKYNSHDIIDSLYNIIGQLES